MTHPGSPIALPTDIDRSAPVVVRLERAIAAPPLRLWQLQTGVALWPTWQHDIESAALEGPFVAGSIFNWKTAGLDETIRSTIYEAQSPHTILWGGPSAGIMGIHRWTFDPADIGTRVTTEESWSGASIDANPAEARKMLELSLHRWLDDLASAATS